MAKKGATKNRGQRKSKSERKRAKAKEELNKVGIEGDLRVVSLHCKAFLDGQEDEATAALMVMGRDASFVVRAAADESGNQGLSDLARKLAAVPPQVDTNLHAMRSLSVQILVDDAMEDAPLAVHAENLMAVGGSVAIFDPLMVQEDLAKSGRARRDPERLQAGDLVWMGLPSASGTALHLRSDPVAEGQPTRRLRLQVKSGLVFVGPPEASDGPRLGTVRLDPFHTALNEHLEKGAFVKVKPGIYAVYAYLSDGALALHLLPDPDPSEELVVDPGALGELPGA